MLQRYIYIFLHKRMYYFIYEKYMEDKRKGPDEIAF